MLWNTALYSLSGSKKKVSWGKVMVWDTDGFLHRLQFSLDRTWPGHCVLGKRVLLFVPVHIHYSAI